MSRRFYVKVKSSNGPSRSVPRVKAAYPFWFLPALAGVGALLAVGLFWLIMGDHGEEESKTAVTQVRPITTVAGDSAAALPARTAPVTSAPAVSLKNVRVQVLNGCGVKGLARRISPALRGLGLDVRETRNAPHSEYEHSAVIDRSGRPDVARALADSLGIDRARVSSEQAPNLPDIDLSLIVGLDYRKLNLKYQPSNGE